MADTVYIRLESDGKARGYRLGPVSGRPLDGDTLAELAEATLGTRVVLLVPAAQLLLTSAELPTRNRRRLLQALPYALEEQLASDVESLHFAVGRGDGRVPVAVVARGTMDGWVEAARAAGLTPHAAYPDVLAVPRADDAWTLLLTDDAALMRTGPTDGYALEPDLIGSLLPLALTQNGPPAALRIIDRRTRPQPDALATLAAAAGVETDIPGGDEPPIALLARTCATAPPAIDLLQGAYSRSEQVGRLLRPWRAAAAVLAAVLLLQIGVSTQTYVQLAQQDEALGARIEQVYREAFPEARKVVDPRLQMERQLAEMRRGGNSDPFVELLAMAGPVLARTKGVEVRALRYKSNELEVELTIGDFQVLDKLKQALAAAGPVQVEIATASARDAKVESRVVIRRASA